MLNTPEFKRLRNNLRVVSKSPELDWYWRTYALGTVLFEVAVGKPELYGGEDEIAARFENLVELAKSAADAQRDVFSNLRTDEARARTSTLCLEFLSKIWKWWFVHAPAEQQDRHGKELLQILRWTPARDEPADGGPTDAEPAKGLPIPVINLGPLRMSVQVESSSEGAVIMTGDARISSGTYARPPLREAGMVMTAEATAANLLLAFQSLPVTSKVTFEVCIHEPMMGIICGAYEREKQRARDADEEAPPTPESST